MAHGKNIDGDNKRVCHYYEPVFIKHNKRFLKQ
jgi:hypothetical protein